MSKHFSKVMQTHTFIEHPCRKTVAQAVVTKLVRELYSIEPKLHPAVDTAWTVALSMNIGEYGVSRFAATSHHFYFIPAVVINQSQGLFTVKDRSVLATFAIFNDKPLIITDIPPVKAGYFRDAKSSQPAKVNEVVIVNVVGLFV